jgi:hypothetical protein
MTGISKGRKAALGVRCHSGWAAAILICGSADDFDVLERRRIGLCDPSVPGSKQPFHAAEPMPSREAECFMARCRASTEALAQSAIRSLADAATDSKLPIAGCGLLCASGRPLPVLKDILASHALIHAAEGEFYRDAVANAFRRLKLDVIRIRERDALRQAADAVGCGDAKLKERIAHRGKSLGPPWTEDQKLATLAALIALLAPAAGVCLRNTPFTPML